MTPTDFLDAIIRPSCDRLSNIMGRQMGSPETLVLLLAIALQESGKLKHRRQVPVAHARGWWQFEAGGAVAGVMRHKSSKQWAQAICKAECVPFVRETIHEALAWHDPLAAAFARLLLWTDPKALPAIGDRKWAWDYYLRNWRPGKPRHKTWPGNYAIAAECLDGAIA